MGAAFIVLAAAATLFAAAVSALPQKSLSPRGRQSEWTDVARIVAVGDLHGAYEEFTAVLKGTNLIDEALHWKGGRTHLVQIGDIIDRGPEARRIYDLLNNLEREAEEAGGRVHMLIGNHEAMALMGISFDYEGFITVEQFTSFLPDLYRRRLVAEFRKKAGPDGDLNLFWKRLISSDVRAQSLYMQSLREHYGRWIASHNTVIKINDVVFVHGGLNDRYSAWPLDRLNRTVSDELMSFVAGTPQPTHVLYDGEGPLWYRDLAVKSEDVMNSELDTVLANLKASTLVVGHTPTAGSRSLESLTRFSRRLWIIDTGIWNPISGRIGALIIENGIFTVWGKAND